MFKLGLYTETNYIDAFKIWGWRSLAQRKSYLGVRGTKDFGFIFIFTESSFHSYKFLIITLDIIFYINNHILYLLIWFHLLYNICWTDFLTRQNSNNSWGFRRSKIIIIVFFNVLYQYTSRISSARVSLFLHLRVSSSRCACVEYHWRQSGLEKRYCPAICSKIKKR